MAECLNRNNSIDVNIYFLKDLCVFRENYASFLQLCVFRNIYASFYAVMCFSEDLCVILSSNAFFGGFMRHS